MRLNRIEVWRWPGALPRERHAPYLIRLIRFIHFAIGQLADLTNSEVDEADEADEADQVWRVPNGGERGSRAPTIAGAHGMHIVETVNRFTLPRMDTPFSWTNLCSFIAAVLL